MAPQRAGRDITKQMLRHRQMVLDQMDFKQKAEEKKMSMSKNIARLAVTAGLTAALSFGGVMAPVTMAFAAGTPTVATEKGKVAITDSEYADTSFKGIQIFTAKVTQDKKTDGSWDDSDAKTLSDIEWAPGNVKSLVTSALVGVTGAPDANADAQTWAEFISTTQGSNFGKTTAVDAGTTLDLIAKALEGDTTLTWTKPSDSTKGSFKDLDHGYWLFVTDTPSTTSGANGNTDAYTSPIFTIVGGSDVNVTPKKNVPNVTKAVKDDATGGTFGTFENPNKAADSQMDDYVDYLLTGTVAGNINTYSTYKYTFKDELPKSMTPKFGADGTAPDVKVKIGDTEVKTGYTAKYENDTITVDFTDLKKCTGVDDAFIALNGNSRVTVEYKAKLDSTKIFDNGKIKEEFHGLVGKAQENKVTLTYSNNPHAENAVGTTVEHPAYDYTYGIDVTKVGSDDETKGLEGVEFTLQETNDTSNFIQADGTKTTDSEQAKLKTDANGKINVVGLDEGTYILKEVKPAPGYNNSHSEGITFTITRGTLPADDATVVNPGCTLATGTDESLVKVAQTNTGAADGKVHLTVTDQKGSGLPLTGLNGVTFTWIAGGAVLCIGVAHLIRSRKQAEESEQE